MLTTHLSTIFHASVPSLPFGGVGESGQGAYHGRSSFECFSHRRSVTSTPSWVERFLTIRYPPYDGKMKQFRRMTARKPNFDREGQVQIGLLDRVLTLGGDDGTGTAVRYLLTALALVLGEFPDFSLLRRGLVTYSTNCPSRSGASLVRWAMEAVVKSRNPSPSSRALGGSCNAMPCLPD